MSRRLDVASLIWGLLFATVAAAGLWVATGHSLSWEFLRLGVPCLLIGLGVLGLTLSRVCGRSSRS